VSDLFSRQGPTLTPVTHSNKAVAVGAVSYYVDHFVTGRVSRFTYGTPCSHHYLAFDPEHVRRERKAYFDFLGRKLVSDGFIPLLLQVCCPPTLS